MGLPKLCLDFIEECAVEALGGLAGKRMLELGNQHMGKDTGIPMKTSKLYYQSIGVEHVSVDLNGRDGAVPADLSEPLSVDWQENFDIVTNAGTTEHVEPLKAQYQCFKNIHESLKVGGVAVHMVPDARALERDGSWGGHCRTYYRSEFFEMLAEYHRYRIVRSKRVNGLCCVGLVKTVSGRFMDETPQFYTQLLFKAQGPQVVWKIYYGVRRMLKIGTFS